MDGPTTDGGRTDARDAYRPSGLFDDITTKETGRTGQTTPLRGGLLMTRNRIQVTLLATMIAAALSPAYAATPSPAPANGAPPLTQDTAQDSTAASTTAPATTAAEREKKRK